MLHDTGRQRAINDKRLNLNKAGTNRRLFNCQHALIETA